MNELLVLSMHYFLKVIPPFYQAHHYISIAIVAISLYNIYLLLRINNKGISNILLFFYTASTIILFSDLLNLITSIFTDIDNSLTIKIFETSNTEYSVAELLFFIHFFYNKQNLAIGRKIINTCFAFYATLTIIFIFGTYLSNLSIHNISKLSIALNVFEFFLLISMCLLYYYSSINKPITSPPNNKHALWVVNSLFIYTSTTLPLIIISEDLRISKPQLYHNMFALHFLTILSINLIIMNTLSKQKEVLI